jgi:hypothetical protein
MTVFACCPNNVLLSKSHIWLSLSASCCVAWPRVGLRVEGYPYVETSPIQGLWVGALIV